MFSSDHNSNFGLYIHWPFCLSKCPYCDFNSHVSEFVDHNRWQNALLRELNFLSKNLIGKKLRSIFFGGGTPSLMDPNTVFSIIQTARKLWPTNEYVEITLEANPSSVEWQTFELFKDAGVNRISLGIQALDDKSLAFLGREHSKYDAINALEAAHKSFDRVSFDLIYARPEQSLKNWMTELDHALALAGEHISVYQLTIEKGTAFYPMHKRGDFTMPSNDLSGALYEATMDKLNSAGLHNYEISNHAKPGSECRHNLIYWRAEDYLGIGAGAHSRITDACGKRWAMRTHTAPSTWLKKTEKNQHALVEKTILTWVEQFTETLVMGLRLKEGILIKKLEALAGIDIEEVFDKKNMELLTAEGYVKSDGVTLKATRSGRQRLDGIIKSLLHSVNIPNKKLV
jgi:putative oxygen-independent coproporphyrinogen III oxidase